MVFLNKMERKLGWLAFPGLLRYYALFHVLVFLLQFTNPRIGETLMFDREKILSGEIWRAVTFLFADSGFGGLGPLGMLFLFFMVMISFLISDSLEGEWGVFRTSMYHYTAFLCLLIANFLYAAPLPGGGLFVYVSAFLAFATLFPKHTFLMFLVIPVQVRWLAMLTVFLLLWGIAGQLHYLGYLLLAFTNYFLLAGIPALRGQAAVVRNAKRRSSFEQKKAPEEAAFHKCETCGETEGSDPLMEFRIAGDGREYCVEHLPGG